MAKKPQLSTLDYARAMLSVAALSFRVAPAAVFFKLAGIAVNAVLPIALTYVAAQTITELTAAYNGVTGAGRLAIIYAVLSAGLGLISMIWNSADNYIRQLMRYKIESKVSDFMYEKFLSLEFWRYEDKATIDLYDRAQKFARFFAYVFDRLSMLVTQLVTMIFALVALSKFMPWLALIVLVAVLPGLIIQFKLSRSQMAQWNKNVDARRTTSFIEWNLFQPDAISELRLNGLARHFMSLRRRLRDKDEGERLSFERRFMPLQLASDALQAIIELGALLWIVMEIIHHRQPLGQFVLVQQLVSRAIGGANSFINQLSTIDEDLGNLYDYQKFMDLPIKKDEGLVLEGQPQEIVFKNVSFAYPNQDHQVLRDISLEIKAGQHIAIVGENGAGKSTFIKLLTGLYDPSQGQITVDGHDLRAINHINWHKQLSVLQQDFQRYVFTTAEENVYFGDVSRGHDKTLYTGAIEQAEAKEFVDKLPQKEQTLLDTWVEDKEGNPGTPLSGGQWQRLALARSFYRNAPIIIMDEPTSAIDALAEGRIFDRLFVTDLRKTVITVSHRLSTIEKADQIYVFENGQIVEQGTHAELVAKKGVYVHLFRRQLK
jgi:ATP-binding cassette, subfamily B, bacterial